MNSHIRYGTFQYVASQAPEELAEFTDYVIDRHYPHLNKENKKYVDFFNLVMQNSISTCLPRGSNSWHRMSS